VLIISFHLSFASVFNSLLAVLASFLCRPSLHITPALCFAPIIARLPFIHLASPHFHLSRICFVRQFGMLLFWFAAAAIGYGVGGTGGMNTQQQ
jgi:hypothetical protein